MEDRDQMCTGLTRKLEGKKLRLTHAIPNLTLSHFSKVAWQPIRWNR